MFSEETNFGATIFGGRERVDSGRPSDSDLYFLSILSFVKSKSLILNPRLDEASLF